MAENETGPERAGVLVALALATFGTTAAPVQGPSNAPPDRILVNGKIWTADDARPFAEAIAVRGDRIAAVGSTAEVRALAGTGTEVLDLRGRLVVPGFQDSHLHFPGRSIDEIDLAGLESLEAFQGALRDFARGRADLRWITGHGWGYSVFPDRIPHKRHIDAVVSDRPVWVQERDGHMGLANSAALRLAGVTRETKDPPNGHIERDASGEPTGELKEAAQDLVASLVPPRDAEERYRSFVAHQKRAAAEGLTSAQNASWRADDQPVYERAVAAGELRLRLRFAPPILPGEGGAPRDHVLRKLPGPEDVRRYRELRERFPGPLLRFGAVKGVLDGTVDAKTAAMFEPYVGGGTGIPFWEQQDLDRVVALWDREGFQVMLHAIGDRAIHMALNAFEAAAKANGTSNRRHRVEHAEVPRLEDLPRFRRLGVIASTQALFAMPDATVLTNYAVVLGPERAARANAFRKYDEAGVAQAFGSDWSVFDFSPLKGIYTAVTRQTPQGSPEGGWYRENRITVEAALRRYTRDGAFANLDDDVRGSLGPGRFADFVVLSKDILRVEPAEILRTEVLLTVMGGRETHRSPRFD